MKSRPLPLLLSPTIHRRKTRPRPALGAFLVLCCALPSARAATFYWDNNGTTAGFGTATGTWAVPTTGDATQGWSTDSTGATLPGASVTTGSGDAINFGSATAALSDGTITVSGTVSSGSITFGANAGKIILSGGTINLNGTITNASGTTQTIGSAINLGSAQRDIVGSTGATTIFNGGVNYGTGRLFPNTTAQTIVLNGAGTGGGASTSSFGITGPSTMRINVAGTIVELGNATALGTGFIQVNTNGTLRSNTALTGANAVGNAFLLGAGNLTISGTNDLELSGTATTFTAPASTAGGAIINAGANRTLTVDNTGATTISGKVSLSEAAATGRSLTVSVAATAGTTTISGPIVNYIDTTSAGTAGSLVKAGAGTLVLSGTSTFSGGTQLQAGTVTAGNKAAFGTGLIQFNSSTAGSASVLQANTDLSGANKLANALTIAHTQGTATIGGAQNLEIGGQTILSSGGSRTLSITNTATTTFSGATALTDTDTAGRTATLNGTGNLTISGAIANNAAGTNTNASGLTYSGSGILTLSGVNTFTGTTTISSGTVRLGGAGQLGAGTYAANITDNGVLAVETSANQTLSGVISGTGSLTKSGAGVLTLSGYSTYSGNTTVDGGTVELTKGGAAGTLRGVLTINSGATARATATDAIGYTAGQQVTQINVNGGTFDIAANTNVGYRTNLSLTGGSVTASVAGGKFDFSAGYGITSNASATTSTISAGVRLREGATVTFDVANGSAATDLAITGQINEANGAGSLTKSGAGTMVLSGVNTYTGATTIGGGTLALGSTGSIDNTSGVSLGTGGTFDISAKGGYSVKALTGSGTVAGPLSVSTTLAIGNSTGTVDFQSNLTLAATSTSVFEVTGGTTGAGSADLANINGTLALTAGAVLDLVQLGTYTANDKFTLLSYSGTLTGTFAGLADGAEFTDAGGQWKINYADPSAGTNGGTGTSFVTITAVPEPGAAILGGLGLLALLRRRR